MFGSSNWSLHSYRLTLNIRSLRNIGLFLPPRTPAQQASLVLHRLTYQYLVRRTWYFPSVFLTAAAAYVLQRSVCARNAGSNPWFLQVDGLTSFFSGIQYTTPRHCTFETVLPSASADKLTIVAALCDVAPLQAVHQNTSRKKEPVRCLRTAHTLFGGKLLEISEEEFGQVGSSTRGKRPQYTGYGDSLQLYDPNRVAVVVAVDLPPWLLVLPP